MTSNQDLFQQAQLAEAAYAHFDLFVNPKNALMDADHGMNFSEAQAAAFVLEWEVIDHVPDTQSDFSATIFRNRQSGAYTLAIRGSTNLADFTEDAALIAADGVAVRQLADLYNYWQRVRTAGGQTYEAAYVVIRDSLGNLPDDAIPVGGSYGIIFGDSSLLADATMRLGVGKIPAGLSGINVAGHSLGGHLAMAFTRLVSGVTTDALAVNGLGFKIGSTTVNDLFAALGGAASFNAAQIQNVYGIAGPEFAAMNKSWLQQPGGYKGIYIESASPGSPIYGGHGASQMTDSLALYSLYAKLAPGLSLDLIAQLLKSASSAAERSLESALDALRKTLLGASVTATPEEDRDALYRNLKALQDSAEYRVLAGGATLRVTATLGRDELVTNAKTDFGHFLAVKYLLPVAIEGSWAVLSTIHTDLYAQWESDKTARAAGNIDLNFTDAYLADRSAFLTWKNKLALEDADASTTAYSKAGATDQWFRDNASNLTLNLGSGAAPADKRRFIFDGDNAGTLSGGSQSDRLYGGGGNDVLHGHAGRDWLEGGAGDDRLYGGDQDDTLIGGEGPDRLEGGKGFDTYIVGQGTDTIVDEDGLGVVKDGQGRILAGAFIQGADGRYSWAGNPAVTATHNSPLTITLENGAQVVIDNYDTFAEGELGIHLLAAPTPLTPGRTILGDQEPIDTDPSEPGVQTASDELGNLLVSGAAPGRADHLYDSAGSDLIQAGGGADRIDATRGGADRIEAGAGRDTVEAGEGDDLVLGGAEADILEGQAGNDRLYPDAELSTAQALALGLSQTASGRQGDWINGGAGDDLLVAGLDNDALFGGAGASFRRKVSRRRTAKGDSGKLLSNHRCIPEGRAR